jgi:hypothetical protein
MKGNDADESILSRYTSKVAGGEGGQPPEDDAADDLGAFGWLRGIRDRAIMLELRRKDGSVSAHGYAWLKKAKFDPSGEITLEFSGETVRITGRNLDSEARPNVRLFSGIVRHRVTWIQEADGTTAMEAAKNALVIEQINEK